MSDWTAAELSAREPNAQPCTSPYCIKMRCTATWSTYGRGCLTYERYQNVVIASFDVSAPYHGSPFRLLRQRR
eukprot:1968260-Prymnesium_polylepis.1